MHQTVVPKPKINQNLDLKECTFKPVQSKLTARYLQQKMLRSKTVKVVEQKPTEPVSEKKITFKEQQQRAESMYRRYQDKI